MKQRIPRKIYLPLSVGLVLVLAVGLGYKQVWHKSPKPVAVEAKYVSFDGDYLFSIPAKYTANGTAMPGVTIVYPEASPPQNGQSLNELYSNGTVAVQPIRELKSNNTEAFKAYVKDVLAVDLRKAFKSASDLRSVKQKGVEAAEVYALALDGKRLWANYAIDFTQPILVVAQDRSEAFTTVGFSMEDLKKSSLKSDIDQAAGATKEVAQRIRDQKIKDLRENDTTKFNKQNSETQLSATLKDSNVFFQRPINIVGGLYNGEYFVAQLVFEAKAQGEQPTPGIVSLQKVGKAWKLDGLQLPK